MVDDPEQHATQLDYTTSPVKWQHEFAGWDAVVYTDEFDGYHRGTPTWVEDTTGTPCTIRVEFPRARGRREDVQTGPETDNDAVIIYDPDEVTVNDGKGERERQSEILDTQSGIRYRVLRVRDTGSPLHFADCEDLRAVSAGDDA